jgi:ubiquinone/menaquinone biosynthesis C-methylase UbiE
MSSTGFKFMNLAFRVRDLLRSRMEVLKEAGIESGFCVLDYGCGPGSYVVPLAQLVGASGHIYALDIHPLAIKELQKKATQKAIENLKTIVSDCNTDFRITKLMWFYYTTLFITFPSLRMCCENYIVC